MRSFIRPGWQKTDWWLVALGVGCLIAGYLFAGMSSHVVSDGMTSADRAAREMVMARRTPILMGFFEALSYAGQKPILITVAAIAAWFISRSKTLVVLVFICGFSSQEMVSGLKDVFGRIRPPTGLVERESMSFPSGHQSGTTAVMLLLGFASLRHKWKPAIVITAGAVLVVITALSRMFLDMHWLSDVIGGTFVGAAMGCLFAILYELLSIRVRLRQPASASPATVGQSSYSGSSYGDSAPPSVR
jgi:membrane-associated phospholipid phosphatase